MKANLLLDEVLQPVPERAPVEKKPWVSWLKRLLWPALLLLAWLVLRNAPWQEIGRTLAGLHWQQILALVVLNLLLVLLFTTRWWLILRFQGYARPLLHLVLHRLSGFGVSYFTPGSQFGGEPLQILLLKKHDGVPAAAALASVSLDKLLELLANFTFLIVALAVAGGVFAKNSAGGSNHLAVILAPGTVLALPAVYLLLLWRQRFPLAGLAHRLSPTGEQPVTRWTRFLQRGLPLLVYSERQIAGLLHPAPGRGRFIFGALLLSALSWSAALFEYWLTLRFLGADLDLRGVLTALVAARLAFLTPLPGGLGALEASQVLAMQALGQPAALGISLSLVIRARDVLLGLLGLTWAALPAFVNRYIEAKGKVNHGTDEN